MKRYLTAIIIIILVLSIGSVVIYSQIKDEPRLTDREVVDHLYEFLISKAQQKQELMAKDLGLKEIKLSMMTTALKLDFELAVFKADIDTLFSTWESLKIAIGFKPKFTKVKYWHEVDIHINSFKKLATYLGEGLWKIVVRDWEWRLNEHTGNVEASNEEAYKFLHKLTHMVYLDSHYGYRIEYPIGWSIVKNPD